jgi:hypothetical protein
MRDSDLDDAYLATNYWVEDAPGGRFCIRSGEPCPELDRLLEASGLSDWAYVTACNPGSELLSEEENAGRTLSLEEGLRGLGYAIFHGRGIGTSGDWPPEPSLLILGICPAQARAIGGAFGQNAIIIGRRGQIARLIWVDDDD